MSRLQGKVAIVTGASKGIGAGVARAYGKAGASVVVNYASDRDGAERVTAEITQAGGKAIAVQGDVAKAGDIERLFAVTKESFGRLDVLVNNAGVFAFYPLEEVTETEFHRQFNINVLGTLIASQHAAKAFGSEGGAIVNISSVVSTSPVPASSIYSATKGAVDTLTVALARELGPRKIRVNAIAPGGTITEGASALLNGDFVDGIVTDTPLGRLGKPEDIAALAVFLGSDDANWITGEVVRASGGLQ